MPYILKPYRKIRKAIFRKNSLSELIEISDFIENFYRQRKISISNKYLREALTLAREVGKLWERDSEDIQPKLSKQEGAKLLTVYRLSNILKTLSNSRNPNIDGKLKLLTKDTMDPSHRDHSMSRETLFELEMYGRLSQITETIKFREGAGADLFFSFRNNLLQMECKFINSMAQLKKRFKEAIQQIEKMPTIPGIIAIQIEKHLPHNSLSNQPTPAQAYKLLESYCSEDFLKKHSNVIQNTISNSQLVKGIFIVAHSTSLIEAKNFIDVGICVVTNSELRAPVGSPDFNLLVSMANRILVTE